MAFNLDKDRVTKREKPFDLSKAESAPGLGIGQSLGAIEGSPAGEGSVKKSYWLPVILVVIALMSGWWLLNRRERTATVAGPSSDIAGSENAVSQEVRSGQPPESAKTSTAAAERTTGESEIARSEVSTASSAGEGSRAGSVSSESSQGAVLTTGLDSEPVAGFGAGSAVPAVDDRRFEEVVAYLSQNPGATLAVQGYASSEGDEAFNQRLSQERADRYKQLIEKAGIAGRRVNAVGRGIANPVATNNTEEGRRQNRRVEVALQK